ncbi:Ig-like domain-containing protein [Pseudomonas stutzeri]|nr:Ig-like domain-containing protein [Stutzerimonas degradans]
MFWNKRKTAAGHPTSLPARSPLALPLEARMMFDGAVAATVADTAASEPTDTPDASNTNDASPEARSVAPDGASADHRQEIIFIDANVQDYAQLIQSVGEATEVVVLDGSKDGLQQIADYLNGRSGIDAIHIVSHGSLGQITLGAVTFDQAALAERATTLSAVGQALTESGDIFLYGCYVGQTLQGQSFVDEFSRLTGADVAASTDMTSGGQRGGDWDLEYRTGEVVSTLELANAWSGYDNALVSIPTNVTIDFSNEGFVESADHGSNVYTKGDIKITYNAANWFQDTDDGQNGSAGLFAGASSGAETITVETISGNEFDFASFFINAVGGGFASVEGFRNGASTGVQLTGAGFGQANGSFSVALQDSIFDNVDKVVITSNAGGFFDIFDSFVLNTVPNAAPTLGNLNGDTVAWSGVGNSVRLDVGSNASLTDTELGALGGGNGNWAGGSLVIQRNGTAVSSDLLGFDTSGALFTVSGGALQYGGQTFAIFTDTGGVLTVNFTSSGTTATTALVNDVVQRITYRSDTPAGDANMRLTLNDGAGGSTSANVTVASDTIYVTSANDTATINPGNGVSFSEAVAIAANDTTGSQTIVFASTLAGQTLNLNTVSLNESLTFNLDAASGLTLTGGTITLAGGTTQTFTNGSGDTAAISSIIAGSGALTKDGAGNLTLSGAGNTFSGATSISAGTLTVANGDALSSNSNVAVASGATLALSSSETIGNLSGAGSVNLGSNTLGIVQTADTIFSGGISGAGGLSLNQTGSASYSLTLSGSNTYIGATTLSSFGWLKLDGEASMSNSSAVRVNGSSVLTLLSDQTVGSLASNTATASIQLGGHTLSTGADNSSTTVSGVISGSGALVKLGSGTMTLAGSNTYAGSTTVSAGTLSIASDANLGAGNLILAGNALEVSGATTIDNAIVLTGNSSIGNNNAVTLSGAISGAYDLTKTGSGTLALSGSNSYAATHVNGGTLSVASDANLGSDAINLAAGTTLALTGATIIDNAIVLGGNATLAASANATVSGAVSGAFTLTKTGASTLTLSGANSYGSTTVSAGTLSVAGDANLGSETVTLGGGTTLAVTGTTTIDNAIALSGNATLNSAADTTLSGVISGSNNLTKTGAATLTLSGSNTYSGSTSVAAGTLNVASDANLGAGSLNLTNGTTLQVTGNTTIDNALALTGVATINAGAAATLSGVIGGSGGLTKSGSGNLTLSASNTNLGNITVAAGTLVVDGSTNSATTVTSGATLAGSGTLGGDVVVLNGGTLSPGGGGAGTLTVNGNLTLNAGSTLALDLNGPTAGTGYDRVVVNGAVDVSGATLAATHGYAAGSGDNYTVIVNDAADAVTGTFSGVSEGSKFNAAGSGTELTTSYVGGSGNDLTLTAPTAPTVTSVSSSTANGTYKIGDTIVVTVQFSSTVNVTGTPTLTLETGTTDRVLNYLSGSGSDTLSFSYTVQAGDSSADLEYASTSALSLNGGTIQDGASQSAVLVLPTPGAAGSLGANKALVVDGVRPAASSITLSDTALRIGETATVTVTFNEAVLGLDIADFSVANGSLSGLSSSDGGLTWTATFTPSGSTTDASNIITLDNSGVMDLAGNIGSGSIDSNNYVIDTQRPTAVIQIADSTLKAGQSTTVTVTFSEAVTGLTTADFSVANGTLSNLSTSDNITYTATLTPSANVTDSSNLITLDNTGYTDAAGNTGTGSTDSGNYAIDTQRPTASIIVADTALKAGQNSTVTITFSEAVSGLSTADFNVANGTLSNLASSDGGITWTATLTPSANVTDPTNLITLDNTGYSDAAGNTGIGSTDSNNYAMDTQRPAATIVVGDDTLAIGETTVVTIIFNEAVTGLSLADFSVANGTLSNLSTSDNVTYTAILTPNGNVSDSSNLIILDDVGYTDAAGNTGTGSTDSNNYAIDTQRPTASIQLSDAALAAGDTATVTITFNEAVTGLTLADLSATNGTLGGLSSNDGGITWTATLTPNANATASNNLITLDNTGVQDTAGNIGMGATLSNNYAVDTVVPLIGSVSVPAGIHYAAGDTLTFVVNASEAVLVDGTPRLALDIGGSTVFADYVAGSGTTALVFRYSVQPGLNDADGITVSGLQNNGGSLRDATGNAVNLTLNNVGDTSGIRIDTIAPSATIALDPASSIATQVRYTVTFSEDVSGVDLSDFSLVTSGSISGSLGNLVQIDARTYQITITNVVGGGSLALALNGSGTGIGDAAGNTLAGGLVGQPFVLSQVEGDPEFRSAAPTVSLPDSSRTFEPAQSTTPPSPFTSPLLPAPLFEQPTLGSGIPTTGDIFINRGQLAPSYLAQVFASSDRGAGASSGVGFLGFGGGDGGVFGTSSFSSIFAKEVSQESEGVQLRWGRPAGSSLAGAEMTGAPTLSQQLHQIGESEQRQVRDLAWALGQMPLKMPEA